MKQLYENSFEIASAFDDCYIIYSFGGGKEIISGIDVINRRSLQMLQESFSIYEKALNDNDINVMNKLFYNNDFVVRYGSTENLYGYTEIVNFRYKRNPATVSRVLCRNSVILLQDDIAIINSEFVRGSINGRQTQVWHLFTDGWKIITAHISTLNVQD